MLGSHSSAKLSSRTFRIQFRLFGMAFKRHSVFPALFLIYPTLKYLFLIFTLYFRLLTEVPWYMFTDSHTWDQSL